MIEYIFDSARTVSDLVFSGTLTRYPDIQWVFPHGGGALPLLADRMELSRFLFQGDVSGPSVQDQIRRLWFDMAGSPFPSAGSANSTQLEIAACTGTTGQLWALPT
jgi:hypothetical protein